MTTKTSTEAIVEFAKGNPSFRDELLGELVRDANTKDFAIDEFSQHNMLRNLRGGDLVQIRYSPNRLHPQRVATRLVDSDFDPAIPGVLLRGLEGQEMLADRGQGQPLIWEPGAGQPGLPVLELRLARAQLRLAQEDDGKATAAQVQFALDLAKEKGKDYSKSDLQSKSNAEISKMIEDMQQEETKASEKQVSYALDLLKAQGKSSPSKSGLEGKSEVEISKLIDDLKKSDKSASMSKVAQKILDDMGGAQRLVSLLGARKLEASERGLSFEWPNRQQAKGNKVAIALGPKGTYDVVFFNKSASDEEKVQEFHQIYPDKLATTFEKHTGWFLTV